MEKNIKLSIVCGIVSFIFPHILFAQEKELKETISTFFEGFHQRDTLTIQSVCSEKMQLQSVISGSKGVRIETETTEEFYREIASIAKELVFEERLLGYEISIYGAMALVRTPYEFYFNGKKSHKGVNVFTLYNDGVSWKIVHVIDTREKFL